MTKAAFSTGTVVHVFKINLADKRDRHQVPSVACSDALLKNKKQVKVDLADLRAFDSELAASLRLNPSYHLPLVSHW